MRNVYILLVICSLIVVAGCSSQQYQGKSVTELMALNKPVDCTVIQDIEKVRAEHLPGDGFVINTKFSIFGNKVRESGISVWSDGVEHPAGNIFNFDKRVLYNSLSFIGQTSLEPWWGEVDMSGDLDGDGKGNDLADMYQEAFTNKSKVLQCMKGNFGEEMFAVPEKLCYWTLERNKKPDCSELIEATNPPALEQ